ncbi:MAG: UvrD-helicase domain-containing protein [Salinibacter sp.]
MASSDDIDSPQPSLFDAAPTDAIDGTSPTGDDDYWRARIGPWREEGLADLSAFRPDTNFLVRAAAGSGKTTALVARMTALIRTGAATPGDMAAITFTRKAAGEMEERFYAELRQARRALADALDDEELSSDERDRWRAQRGRVETALRTVQQCFIGTIHAFCGRLLREHAFEAGLPPDFRVGLEDRDEEELRRRVWADYVDRVRREAPDRLDEIQDLGLTPDDLADFFETLSRYPELDLYTNAPDAPPSMDEAVAAAQEFVRAWQAQRPESPLKDRDGAQEALDRAEGMMAHRPLDQPAEQARLLELMEDGYSASRESGKVTLSAWGGRGSDAYEAARTLRDEAYPKLMEEFVRPVLRRWQAYVHERAVAFVEPATEAYLERRREEGQLTHHDVLYFTRNLLRDHSEIRRRVQRRTPRLLVDEFQDTDPLQAEILFYLASRDPAERDWTQCTPRPGSLFIVGDDKQSIYRFRRADIEVFERVVALVDRAGGTVADLTKNFRSHGQICDFCDRAFGDAFAVDALADVQADYEAFDPQRPRDGTAADSHSLRRIQVDYKYRNNGAAIATDDADQIARFIRSALDAGTTHEMAGPADDPTVIFPGGAAPEDFLLLTRKKKRLPIYAEALAERQIPFTVTGSQDLRQSEDLRDFVDLLTCALRPDDPVAAVAYLQGGLVGLSDGDLYELRQACDAADRDPFSAMETPLPASVLDALSDDLADRVQTAYERVRRAREIVRERRPALALPAIAEAAGLLPAAAHPPAADDGSLRAGRLLKTFALVQREAEDGADWAQVLDLLQDVVDGAEEVDGLTLESGAGGAVRLMNVHQAKGLEAPVVFLADPYSSGGGNHGPTRHIHRGDGAPQLVAPVTEEVFSAFNQRTITHAPRGWHADSDAAFETLEEQHEAAEATRLAYVAATRAERLLVVSTYHDRNDERKDGPWQDLNPPLSDDIPLLPSPDTATTAPPEAPAPSLDAHADRRADAVVRASDPSFHEHTVHAEGGDGASLSDKMGRGRVFGTAVHALLERVVTARRSEGTISVDEARAALRQAYEQHDEEAPDELPDSHVQAARAHVDRFLRHPFSTEIASAPRVYTEYPFAEATPADDGATDVLRGTIDLAFPSASGWHIFDFKTAPIDDAHVDDFPADHPYTAQVHRYADVWAELTGAPIVFIGLWFTGPPVLVDVTDARTD